MYIETRTQVRAAAAPALWGQEAAHHGLHSHATPPREAGEGEGDEGVPGAKRLV